MELKSQPSAAAFPGLRRQNKLSVSAWAGLLVLFCYPTLANRDSQTHSWPSHTFYAINCNALQNSGPNGFPGHKLELK